MLGLFALLFSLLLGLFRSFGLLSLLLRNNLDGALHLYAFGSAFVLAVFVRSGTAQEKESNGPISSFSNITYQQELIICIVPSRATVPTSHNEAQSAYCCT